MSPEQEIFEREKNAISALGHAMPYLKDAEKQMLTVEVLMPHPGRADSIEMDAACRVQDAIYHAERAIELLTEITSQ